MEAAMAEMLSKGFTVEQVLEHFKNNEFVEKEETEMEKRMRELSGLQDKSEMLELLKDQLGPQSKLEIEKMLKEGKSIEEVLEHIKKHGKTNFFNLLRTNLVPKLKS